MTEPPPPLNSKRWAEFLFPDVFRIEKGFYNKKPTASGAGTIPFLGAIENNNGITEFYTYDEIYNASKIGYGKNESIDRKIFEGNAIAVTNNGSVGHAFYQSTQFTCSHDINPLYLKNYPLNESIALFLIACIEKQGLCFAYARKWRPIRMIKSKIFLPVDDSGAPDYEYMEAYVRAIEEKLLQRYRDFVKVAETAQVEPLQEKIWRAFLIGEIFDLIQRGKRLKTADHISGGVPYISSSAQNNGVDDFIGNVENVRTFRDCLTIANSGSVGKNFYHQYEFIASDHVTALSSNKLNKYHYLFLAAQLDNLSEKYSFNREITDARLRHEKIFLPVNDSGAPDFEYMEAYVKNLVAKKYRKYLEYIGG